MINGRLQNNATVDFFKGLFKNTPLVSKVVTKVGRVTERGSLKGTSVVGTS